MYECFSCIYVCAPFMPGITETGKEGIGSLDIGITGGFELPCVCWKLNLGVLQEQLLILISESSLQFPSPPHPPDILN